MPVKPLPENANLEHLKNQAKDLREAYAAGDSQAVQRVREFHPRFPDASEFKLSDAQLSLAREYGFASWPRLRHRVEHAGPADNVDLPMHERIQDAVFRRAVDLLDAGDEAGLRAWPSDHPDLAVRRVEFEGVNYFRNPSLLEFVAENPIRHGKLPENIVDLARAILEAGADLPAVNETLGMVCSGMVPRQCGVQIPLIGLLCDAGADPDRAMLHALGHGEFAAVDALIRRGAKVDLPAAAALGRLEDALQLLPAANAHDRHRALAWAAQYGHVEIVRLLLDAGEDPSRYNPMGAHSHSTPLHQAALAGHFEVVRLLVGRGARLDLKDTVYQGTPEGWAEYGEQTAIRDFLHCARIA